MHPICQKRCVIGEGPIWKEENHRLYFVNGPEREICALDLTTGDLEVRKMPIPVAAMAFDQNGRMLISTRDGVFWDDMTALYEGELIKNANDMKVGPDGRLYVGTQSSKRLGLSDSIDGKLYVIDPNGTVRTLLDGLRLSNGMEWSIDEKRFYHTDSDTGLIREYDFSKETGNIRATGREILVPGVDGFTIDSQDRIYAACWGKGHIAVIDTASMTLEKTIPVPTAIPARCCFAGERMDQLTVVTATYNNEADNEAGKTYRLIGESKGRLPYRFG